MRTVKHPIESAGRLKALFIAEAVTLAHVACPAVWAQTLDSDLYEVSFAAGSRYNHLFSSCWAPALSRSVNGSVLSSSGVLN